VPRSDCLKLDTEIRFADLNAQESFATLAFTPRRILELGPRPISARSVKGQNGPRTATARAPCDDPPTEWNRQFEALGLIPEELQRRPKSPNNGRPKAEIAGTLTKNNGKQKRALSS
jgi:hypothetical protein